MKKDVTFLKKGVLTYSYLYEISIKISLMKVSLYTLVLRNSSFVVTYEEIGLKDGVCCFFEECKRKS